MNPFAKDLKATTLINAFVDTENLLHVQYQIKGGTFYEQEVIFLEERKNNVY